MAGEPFDLERLRQNWARAAEPPPDELPARLAAVEAPRDGIREARALLERIRGMAMAQFAGRAETLEPFFAEAMELLGRMERSAKERAGEGRAAEERAGEERAAKERAGEERAGEGRTAEECAGEERAAEGRAGEEHAAEARAGEEAGRAGGEDGAGAPGAVEDPRARMMELLDELTELLEVFATIGR